MSLCDTISMDCQLQIDLLVETVLSIRRESNGDDEWFEVELDAILASNALFIAMEVESRVWQLFNDPRPCYRIAFGSQAWKLD